MRTAPVAWSSSWRRSKPPPESEAGDARSRAIIDVSGTTRDRCASNRLPGAPATLRALVGWFAFLVCLFVMGLGACTGSGGAVSVRWRISELGTGLLLDPRDVSDSTGACCKHSAQQACADETDWRITRVQLALVDQSTGQPLANAPLGLDASCRARELTTPFELPPGTYAISLRAYDPATPELIQAESPSPEIRTLRRSEIVNLDVVELSVVP